jgi:hypothetical protein
VAGSNGTLPGRLPGSSAPLQRVTMLDSAPVLRSPALSNLNAAAENRPEDSAGQNRSTAAVRCHTPGSSANGGSIVGSEEGIIPTMARRFGRFHFAFLTLVSIAGTIAAQPTTFFYNGSTFTDVAGIDSTADRVSGSFTVPDPLAPDLQAASCRTLGPRREFIGTMSQSTRTFREEPNRDGQD